MVNVELHDDFLLFCDNAISSLQALSRSVLAIELYQQQKVSLSKAALLAGLKFDEFLDELRARGIKRDLGYTSVEELEEEFQAALGTDTPDHC